MSERDPDNITRLMGTTPAGDPFVLCCVTREWLDHIGSGHTYRFGITAPTSTTMIYVLFDDPRRTIDHLRAEGWIDDDGLYYVPDKNAGETELRRYVPPLDA